jgi:hypothetical protein
MKNLNLIYNQIPNSETGGAGGGSPSESQSSTQTATTPSPIPEASGNLDEFGYEVVQAQEAAPNKGAAPDAKPEQAVPPKLEGDVAGYGEKDPEVPAAPPEAPPAPVETKDLGYELDLKEIEAPTAEKIKEFAKANKLSKEQAEAFLNLKKSEIAAVKAADVAYEAHVKQKAAELKASWHKELKSDKTFGGEKFAQNLHNVDKVLTDFLGETKKQLTDSKSMLPPYVMRDLAKLADHLYKGTNLVQGEATAGADEKHFLDELYN